MTAVKESIANNVLTTLQGISISNGYHNDIASVQRWLQRGNLLRNVPAIVISCGQENKKPTPNPLMTCTFTVYLEMYLRQDETDTTPTDTLINSLVADIEKAIMVDYTRGGYAKDSLVTAVLPFETQEGQANAGAIIEISIIYQHLQSDPETSG